MFHLLLLAGTLKTCIHQEDVISQCLFRNVILQHDDVSSGCIAVVWNGKGAAPKREAPNTDGMLHVTIQVNACASYTMYFATEHPSSPEVCWSKFIEACVNTCKMAPFGQCAYSEIPPKSPVHWVHCTLCEGWMHCICAGITMDQLSGVQFVCCQASENNFRCVCDESHICNRPTTPICLH